MVKSVEPKVEDYFNGKLKEYGIHYELKQGHLETSIEKALKDSASKSGGKGGNLPDAKLLLTVAGKQYPVMIEYKGKAGDLSKLDNEGFLDTKPSSVKRYAVNGAVHYARAIVDNTSFDAAIAVGANGYEETGLVTEVEAYLVRKHDLGFIQAIASDNEFQFLKQKNFELVLEQAFNQELTEEERERITKHAEYQLETNLTALNELLYAMNISVNTRVELVSGLIMASLDGAEISGLQVDDLKSRPKTSHLHDGKIIIQQVKDFLTAHELPTDKINLIINRLERVFIHSRLAEPRENGQSLIKEIYRFVMENLYDYYKADIHIDFTGKLFQVMNAWVDVPDGGDNDVVLTPRYVTELMVDMVGVNKDSYVWDYTLGSGGFLVSAMSKMLKDTQQIMDIDQRTAKIKSILSNQLLGIEKLDDMYMLAVLNMILMGDGSANILNGDSLQFDGKYEFGERAGQEFPATHFLLNPPYSAEGKGLIFVEKAMEKMKPGGKAAVLIQENAGSGQGNPVAKRLLEKHSLLASVHMADIFSGKASVRTAIYMFEVGTPHNEMQIVKFIDMDNDGYTRSNRKKSDAKTNLRDTDNATGRYAEVANLVKYGKGALSIYDEDCYVEDTIGLEGDDWTFAKHRVIDTEAKEEDFLKVIGDYMQFQLSLELGE